MRKTRNFVNNRHPIVPVLLTIVASLYVLTLVLVGTDTISATNGCGTVLYSLKCLLWGGYSLFHAKKYIGLGRRLIPLALVNTADSGSSSSGSGVLNSPVVAAERSAAEISLSRLNTFDWVMQVVMILMVASLLSAVSLAVIPGLITPSNQIWARSTFIIVGGFSLLLTVLLTYHLERLIRATRLCGQAFGQNLNAAGLNRAIKIMRSSQIVWLFLGSATFLIHLLGGIGVIDMGWIFVLCLLAIETCASSFAYFAARSRTKKQQMKQISTKEEIPPVNLKIATSPPDESKRKLKKIHQSLTEFIESEAAVSAIGGGPILIERYEGRNVGEFTEIDGKELSKIIEGAEIVETLPQSSMQSDIFEEISLLEHHSIKVSVSNTLFGRFNSYDMKTVSKAMTRFDQQRNCTKIAITTVLTLMLSTLFVTVMTEVAPSGLAFIFIPFFMILIGFAFTVVDTNVYILWSKRV